MLMATVGYDDIRKRHTSGLWVFASTDEAGVTEDLVGLVLFWPVIAFRR
jgi:hypothetical protein